MTHDAFAEETARYLINQREEDLYIKLGMTLDAIKKNPHASRDFQKEILVPMGLVDVMKDIGKKFFDRLNIQCYNLICGDDKENKEDREKFITAFHLNKADASAILTGLLVAYLGLSPAVAPIVAALVVKIILNAAQGAVCEVWSKNLPQ